jgi:hypothetical protein
MKNGLILIFFLFVMTILAGCGDNPRTEITSSSVENSIATGSITQVIEGYRPARIELMVYDFNDIPKVDDPKDYKQVSSWLVDYAHCYQNGVELQRSYYYHHEDSFKQGKRCKLTVFYQVPDDGQYEGLKFSFDLDGFKANSEGEFNDNVKTD